MTRNTPSPHTCAPGSGVDEWYSGGKSEGATSPYECYILQGDRLRLCIQHTYYRSSQNMT